MRKNRLIALIGTLTMAAAGLVASLGNSNKVQETKASDKNQVYLHATDKWEQASAWFAIYGFQFENEIVASNKTIYYVNTDNWSEVYVHGWDGTYNTDGHWPGNKMTKIDNCSFNSHDVYKYELKNEIDISSNQKLIFNNNKGNQTSNISVKDGSCLCFDKDGYLSGLNGYGYGTKYEHWSKMEKVQYDGSDKTYYVGDYTSGDTLIFVRKNPANDKLDWDGVWNKSYDLKGIPSGNNCYRIDNNDGEIAQGSWHIFNPDGDNKEYAFGNFGVKNAWSISSGVKMAVQNENELKVVLPLKAKDELKFFVNNIEDPCYDENYKIVIKSNSPIKAKINEDTKNIVMPDDLEEGAYIIYWSYASEDWGCYIAKDVDTARSLELYVMQYDTDGQCTTKFYSARTRYLAMTGEEQVAFRKTEASVRYESWAAHLGENPWENAKASSLVNFYTFSKDSANTWIIVAISITGIAAVGLFFIYRKRKEN